MSYIIDRRLNDPKKSTVNRQRFLKRYRQHIKKAVSEAINNRSIKDLDRGEKIGIPAQDIDEPVFNHAPGGERDVIHPGNREFVKGDTFPRPPSGSGGGSGEGKASNKGEGMDEFVFQITQEEFLDFMFDDLALPNLIKKQLAGTDSFKWVRAGISKVGVPAKINIVRSLHSANARRIAIGGSKRKRLRKLEQQLVALREQDEGADEAAIDELESEMLELKKKLKRIPFIDDFDIKYNLHVKEPMPSSKAVMFCLMDVSGSMSQATKDMAKRFFILLYLFLQRNYDHIDVVFIRHHTSAKEVDEEEFFYSRETGGTIVSSALKLMKNIMDDRYPVSDWNIYAAQASDGDNWNDDSPVCRKMLEQEILPLMQYFAYTEITPREHQALWREYEKLQGDYDDCFALRQIVETSDIYPVFRDLFQKRMQAAVV